jgi:hypothetical protein
MFHADEFHGDLANGGLGHWGVVLVLKSRASQVDGLAT